MNDVCMHQVLPPVLCLVPYLNFPADIQQDALCRDINRPFINATKSSAIWPWSKHIFTQKDKATIYISKGIFCVQASSTVYIQVLSFNIASAAKCSHSSALPWCQHWLIPEKVPFQKKKKNPAISGTAQLKVFILRAKVQRDEPLIKVVSKGKILQKSGRANKPKCIPANPSHSHQYALLIWPGQFHHLPSGMGKAQSLQLCHCSVQVSCCLQEFLSELVNEVQNKSHWVSQPPLVCFFQFPLEFVTLPSQSLKPLLQGVPAHPRAGTSGGTSLSGNSTYRQPLEKHSFHSAPPWAHQNSSML